MRQALLVLFSLCMLMNADALAQESPNDPKLAQEGWLELTFDNKKPNDYSSQEDGSIAVATNDSVSVLYQQVNVDLAKTPKLAWTWKVDQSVPVTDLRVKGQDDRSLAVYVSFPFDEERATWWEGFIRALVVAFKGEDTPGRVISYVWGGDEEAGTILESPYLKSAGGLIMLRRVSEAGGQWFDESVDVAADYQRIFGVPANTPYQIAISADSDDSKVSSSARIKGIRFE